MSIQIHDIVQVDPSRDVFGGCMVVVTEIKGWEIQGYVQSAGVPGQQYIRLTNGEFEPTGGRAVWGIATEGEWRMSALSAAASDEDGDIIKNLQARMADLEAQLYAVGAGGVGSTVARQDHPEQSLDMVPAGWKLVPVEPTEEMLRSSCGCESPAMFRESLRRETDERLTAEMVERIIRRHLASYRAMLAAAPHPPVVEQPQGEQEPDWTNSETGLLECWKSPLHPMPDRLQMADGAVAFRDKTIANLRLQIASYQSAQQLTSVEHSSAVQPQGEQEPVAYYVMNGAALFQLFRSKSQADALAYDLQKRHDLSGSLAHFHVVPLYTHPQPKRQPLTVGQINRLIADGKLPLSGNPYEVARAIERAHGIGGEA